MTTTIDHDRVWNNPPPVEIQGKAFTVRELPAGKLRLYMREILSIMGRASRAREDEQADVGVSMIEDYADQAVALISEATGLEVQAINDLPGSVFMELASAVLAAQEPMVKAFFRLRQQAAELAPKPPGQANGNTGRHSSSESSSAPDSTLKLSSND